MYYEIFVGSYRYHGDKLLTYSSETFLDSGTLVRIPLGNRSVLGIVGGLVDKPKFKVKEITQTWQSIILPAQSLSLIKWLSEYYPAPLGSIVELFTPPNMLKGTKSAKSIDIISELSPLPPLTQEQALAMREINKNFPKSILIHGDTGTGKTRLYIELVLRQIRNGKSVIVMTPEIGLTKPLMEQFTKTFGNIVKITHSALSLTERRSLWIDVAATNKPQIVIGPRSALFYPVNNIGMIVIDEAHDTSYKQDSLPYYQATRVAAQLCKISNAQLVMGTATPLIADYFLFLEKKLPIIRLGKPAISSDVVVENIIIDSKNKQLFTRSPNISDCLFKYISQALTRNEQSLLFLNKRGSARSILCSDCGWQAQCPKCDSYLTFHEDTNNIRCHSCDYKQQTPQTCPECRSISILFKSIGTKALEKEINKKFPQANIARFDSDTHKTQNLASRFDDLKAGKIDIIIGTQSIAKGFDLPKLSVVGIIQADSGLYMPDYTSEEKTYQLISQVSGRIGRGHRDGKLIVQSHNPQNPILTYALDKNYQSFYESQLEERRVYNFPPHAYLMIVSCSRASSSSSEKACEKILKTIRSKDNNNLQIDGPAPRFIEMQNGKYSWQLIIKSPSRQKIIDLIKYLPPNCSYNLDPSNLL